MEDKSKVVIVGANVNEQEYFLESMIELASLCDALDYEVVNSYSQNLKEINKGFYIGEGKAKEIALKIKDKDLDYVVFNNELSPLQLQNLENVLKVKVIDRTMLILDIFSIRAKTKEAKLQVELTMLEYMMPRMLTISHVADKQRGGNKNKGLGEKLLDLDKRRITGRILALKKELQEIEKQKIVTSKQRNKSDTPKVCLVGYTNAGKSSLMNTLIEMYGVKEDKKVFEKDMLFATLDTSTRKIVINKKDIIISDTVGFVSLLPHTLIESFKSTLSELRNADLLIHVIDSSNPNYLVEKKVCEDTINSILNGEEKKIINVYSKIDLPTNNLIEIEDHEVFVSSKSREGMNDLVDLIFTTLYPNIVYHKLFIPYNEISEYYKIDKLIFEILKNEEDEGIYLEAYCPMEYASSYNKYIIEESSV